MRVSDGRPTPTSLTGLAQAQQACQACPLYRNATQAVPGEGPRTASLMVVGEQPGDQEDKQGHPFVGPAGWILDRALAEAGLDRGMVFVTNAVKHFKFEPRGKRRLHKKPSTNEIDICSWWLDLEREIVKPKAILALGVSALRGVTGKNVTVKSAREHPLELDDGTRLTATVHPSYLLRQRTDEDRRREYKSFVADLVRARELVDG